MLKVLLKIMLMRFLKNGERLSPGGILWANFGDPPMQWPSSDK